MFSTLDSNLEYLRQLPAKRLGLPALTGANGRSLANPQPWALASHAHSRLLLENPAQTTATQVALLTELSREGDNLHALLRQIGTSDTAARSGSTLFNALIDDDKTQAGLGATPAASSLVGELKKEEATYLATVTGHGSPATLGLDLCTWPLTPNAHKPAVRLGLGKEPGQPADPTPSTNQDTTPSTPRASSARAGPG